MAIGLQIVTMSDLLKSQSVTQDYNLNSHQLQKWQDSDNFKNNYLINISNILSISCSTFPIFFQFSVHLFQYSSNIFTGRSDVFSSKIKLDIILYQYYVRFQDQTVFRLRILLANFSVNIRDWELSDQFNYSSFIFHLILIKHNIYLIIGPVRFLGPGGVN